MSPVVRSASSNALAGGPERGSSKSNVELRDESSDEERLSKDLSQLSPQLADWFEVGASREKTQAKGKAKAVDDSESGSDTEPEDEPDSENDDTREEPDAADDDDWEQVEKESPSQDKVGHNWHGLLHYRV